MAPILAALFICALYVCVTSRQETVHAGGKCNPYCAETSLRVIPETQLPPPPVNQVFKDPDFGSRMLRVTDESGIHGQLAGFNFMTNSSAETNEWGKFDPRLGPHGGYHFYVTTSGGGAVFFTMDADTMQVTPVCGSLPRCRLSAPGTFSYTDPNVFYTHLERTGSKIDAYDLVSGKQWQVYDFSKCPNIPHDFSGYEGGITNSGDDNQFLVYFGGRIQGFTTLVAYYDRSTDRCYWYDTRTGTVGGTQMATTSVSASMLPTPGAPVLKPTTGTLPAGDYYVQVTASTRMNPAPGETLPSPESHIRLESSGGIEVSPPAVDNPWQLNVVGYSVYMATAPGREKQQATLQPLSAAYVQASKLKDGPAPPTISTAGHNVHNARLSRDGKVVRVNSQQRGGMTFWIPGTTKISACWNQGPAPNAGFAGRCGGHTVLGYTHLINNGGPGPYASLLLRPLSNLDETRQLLPRDPGVLPDMDTHWSWDNANPSDSAPVCGSFSRGSFRIQGDGTLKRTNPLLAIQQPWDREIVCVATNGPPTVWRFAHHRATGACNSNARDGSCFGAIAIGNVSQDGKFYLFSSDWEWTLGGNGCPTSGRCRVDSFIVELK
jgi:hypothetical protein